MVVLGNPNLVAFRAVVRLKTVRAASKELGLTQAAVTKRIRALESEIQTTLFIRSRRGMSLTEEGNALLSYCKKVNQIEGEFLSQIKGDKRRDVSITIVGPTSTISNRLPFLLKDLYKEFPFLRLNLQINDHSDLVEKIRRGEADIAIVSPEHVQNEMESKVMKPIRYVLVAPSNWKGRNLKELINNERIIDFNYSDRTTFNYLEKYDLNKHIGRSRLFINNTKALISYVLNGVGFATLSEWEAKPYIENGDLILLNKGRSISTPLAATWFSRSKDVDYFNRILQSLK